MFYETKVLTSSVDHYIIITTSQTSLDHPSYVLLELHGRPLYLYISYGLLHIVMSLEYSAVLLHTGALVCELLYNYLLS